MANYDEFKAHIEAETKKAKEEALNRIANTHETSVGCVDPLSKDNDWNPPGGGIFLAQEGYLKDYMKQRRVAHGKGATGELAVHHNCGYMRVILGLDDPQAQSAAIKSFQQQVDSLNQELGTAFTVHVDPDGSATPYMQA